MPKGRTFSAEARAAMFGTEVSGGEAPPPEYVATRENHEWFMGEGSPTILGASSPSTEIPEAEEE
eukprot:5710061-Lingulodinium_polyedra.AAC.1